MSIDASPVRAGGREWAGLAVLALPTLLVAIDVGVLFLALPSISVALGASGAEQLWIVDIYGFLLAGFLVTMGSLGDRFGRRRLLFVGAVGFAAASLLAAYAPTVEALIVARALLGIAGATLAPSTLALITTMFRDPRQRGVALSLWAACLFGGTTLGPVIGGVLLEYFWWGSVFLIAVPVMVLLLVFGPVVLPEHRTRDASRMDFASVALSLATILPVVYGVKELAAGEDVGVLGCLALVAAGVSFGVAFVRRQLRLPEPMLDLRLLRDRTLAATLCAMCLAAAAMGGVGLLASQYLQSGLGLSPGVAGLWNTPMAVGIAAGSLLASAVAARLGHGRAIAAGLALSLTGWLLFTQAGTFGGAVTVAVAIGVIGLGAGPLFVLGTGLVVGAVRPDQSGAAAAMSETSSELGASLGVALVGALAAAIYRGGMSGVVPPEAAETIAGAAAAAERLPGQAGAELALRGHDAFVVGIQVTTAVSTVLVAALAFVMARVPKEPRGAQPRDELSAVGERE